MSDNKKASMLTLEPRESIVFEGPFNRSQCKSLILGNPSKTQNVAFKLKTTSPRMFFVRPNIGHIGPDTKVTVDIFMQPITQDAGQKPIKFLLQAALVSGNDIDLQEFWKEKKSADIWESKLTCALVQRKPSEVPKAEGVIGFNAKKVSEPVTKLKVSILESEAQSREAGGTTDTVDPKAEGEIDFDAVEVSEPVAQLLKQVSILEDERIFLKEEISILKDQTVVHQTKPLSMEIFIITSCCLTILAALLGAYCGKLYL